MHSKFASSALFFAFFAASLSAQAVHYAAPGVSAPVLLPSAFSVSTPKSCTEMNGIVRLAAVVDPSGSLRDLKILNASDKRLIPFASELVSAQRFRPGTADGSPASVAVEISLALHTCALRLKHPKDDSDYTFTLHAHPFITLAVAAKSAPVPATPAAPISTAALETIGGHVSAPVPIQFANPEFPDVPRKNKRQESVVIGLVVDTDGLPRNLHVVESSNSRFNENALHAAAAWRFEPALKDAKTPVSVEGTFINNFSHFDGEAVAITSFVPELPDQVVKDRKAHTDQSFTKPVVLDADEVFARYYPMSRVPGTCLIAMLIDTDGTTHNVQVIKSLDSSIDLDLAAMFTHLHFKPAMKDGSTPVPMTLIVPVRYTASEIAWHNRETKGNAAAGLIKSLTAMGAFSFF